MVLAACDLARSVVSRAFQKPNRRSRTMPELNEQDTEADEPVTPEETSEESAASETSNMPKRLGTIDKCPICGSGVDAEAYHCPTCHNSYCFHCRARVLPSDTQYQCTNQACSYYGKLLCKVCEELVEQDEPPAVYMEPEEGYWPILLVAMMLAAGLVWHWTSFSWAALFVLVGFPVTSWVLNGLGLSIFRRERRVEHHRKSRFYLCLCCRQAVKETPGAIASMDAWQRTSPPC